MKAMTKEEFISALERGHLVAVPTRLDDGTMGLSYFKAITHKGKHLVLVFEARINPREITNMGIMSPAILGNISVLPLADITESKVLTPDELNRINVIFDILQKNMQDSLDKAIAGISGEVLFLAKNKGSVEGLSAPAVFKTFRM